MTYDQDDEWNPFLTIGRGEEVEEDEHDDDEHDNDENIIRSMFTSLVDANNGVGDIDDDDENDTMQQTTSFKSVTLFLLLLRLLSHKKRKPKSIVMIIDVISLFDDVIGVYQRLKINAMEYTHLLWD
jgi:hypothetical protein